MSGQPTRFLIKGLFWLPLISLICASTAMWLCSWPFLIIALIMPLTTVLNEPAREMLRALDFMPLGRARTRRGLWLLLVMLPLLVTLLCIPFGVLTGPILSFANEVNWRQALVATAHSGSLSAIVFLGLTLRRSHFVLDAGLRMLPALIVVPVMMTVTLLFGERGAALNAYLESPKGAVAGLALVPLLVWSWLRAPLFRIPLMPGTGSEEWRPRNSSRSGASQGLQGLPLLFGSEAGRMIAMAVAIPMLAVLVDWFFERRDDRGGSSNPHFILFWMPMFIVTITPFPVRELRFQLLRTSHLALAILAMPAGLAAGSTALVAWTYRIPPGDLAPLAASFVFFFGLLAFWRVLGLMVSPSIAPFLVMLPLLAFMIISWQMGFTKPWLVTACALLGLAMSLGCWWALLRLLRRGSGIYTRNRMTYSRLAEVMTKRG
jgi:hypothetical protein